LTEGRKDEQWEREFPVIERKLFQGPKKILDRRQGMAQEDQEGLPA